MEELDHIYGVDQSDAECFVLEAYGHCAETSRTRRIGKSRGNLIILRYDSSRS